MRFIVWGLRFQVHGFGFGVWGVSHFWRSGLGADRISLSSVCLSSWVPFGGLGIWGFQAIRASNLGSLEKDSDYIGLV